MLDAEFYQLSYSINLFWKFCLREILSFIKNFPYAQSSVPGRNLFSNFFRPWSLRSEVQTALKFELEVGEEDFWKRDNFRTGKWTGKWTENSSTAVNSNLNMVLYENTRSFGFHVVVHSSKGGQQSFNHLSYYWNS